MKEIKQLIGISKFLERLALFLFVFIWAEVIFIFLKYASPGQLLYKEYGENGMAYYLILILTFMFILLGKAKKINDLANKIVNNNMDLK